MQLIEMFHLLSPIALFNVNPQGNLENVFVGIPLDGRCVEGMVYTSF